MSRLGGLRRGLGVLGPLLDVQAHVTPGGEVAEGGQYLALYDQTTL